MNPLRPAILAAAASPRMKRILTGTEVTADIVRRFVPGESRAELAPVVRALLGSGRLISVDYLGENTTDRSRAEATVAEYLSLINELAAADRPVGSDGAAVPVEVSVKLSALGQALPGDGPAIASDNLRTVCTKAVEAGVWVTVDAEDHTTTDATLATVRELRPEFPWLGAVLQAYLHRTRDDCVEFAGPGSRIRLCKGAYREPAAVAYQRNVEVSDSYLRCLEILMRGTGYPMVATHDPALVLAAERIAAETGRSAGTFEHQMLYGVREAEQLRLAAAGHTVRVYVPYGDDWYGYLTRRLAERPANLRFFLRALVAGRADSA
ncbi:proline dehydrogenase family protein [Nocardia amikacinitolerans]|uniref:proline dehydrogenase family protein n=1 Tax=Nocardia amikacinitolerans TaxID=756689 RepID=UPI0020A3E2AD|nr:proline dehydrogenase family protein [Nocardia amikacinitolerans]MCP2290208.1 L-proline dehydrogenase [Nocardia amikacinitolerans]